MAFNSLTTKIGDLRLVLAPGMEVPQGQGPIDVQPGGGGAVIPSYETDTEDWRDKEKGGGGGGGPGPKKKKPKSGGGGGGGGGERGEPGLPSEPGEPGEEEEGEGEGDSQSKRAGEEDDDYKNLSKKYAKSGTKDSDAERNKVLGEHGDPVIRDEIRKARDQILTNPKTRPQEMHPGYDPMNPKDHYTLGGFGIGRELNNTGYRPLKTGAWAEAVRKWFKSKEFEVHEDMWTREESQLQSVYHQLGEMYGSNVRLPARDVPVYRNRASRVVCFVDVSGSVFSKGIQFDFTSIIKSVKPEEADVYIFTFDDGIRSPVMRPWNYVPMEGGGGTQPWEGIAEVLRHDFYREADGYIMLTDGAFAAPPPNLIVPSKWCFLMTSEYQKSGIPPGCTILETFVDDPEYIKAQEAKGKPKDPFKRAVIAGAKK